MFLSSTLPLLPPPHTSLLPTNASSIQNHPPTSTTDPSNPHHVHMQLPPPLRRPANKHAQSQFSRDSLAALTLDERLIESRKMAIRMYGYSWLRPAGCAKTMLGRREEEVEREEVERQLREAEEGEERAAMMEEMARQQQQLREEGGGGGAAQGVEGDDGGGERDLDEEIPDADDDNNQADEDGGADLDDEVPEADHSNLTFEVTEGETGITDDVERTDLGLNVDDDDDDDDEDDDQQALANAMLDEDEQGMAERDLDDDVPDLDAGDVAGRDLDDDVPEAEHDGGEGEWQHTDTELEDEDESGMDISLVQETSNNLGQRDLFQRQLRPLDWMQRTPDPTVEEEEGDAQSSSVIAGIAQQQSGLDDSVRRGLFSNASASASAFADRRNLFGRAASNLFTTPQASAQINTRRSSGRLGRRGGGGAGAGRVNSGGLRDSLD